MNRVKTKSTTENFHIELKGVAIGYGGKRLLSSISFQLPHGGFIGIAGPNGGGKTTLIKTVLGIISPLSGSVRLADNLRFGYVPQRHALDSIFPLTAMEMVRAGGIANSEGKCGWLKTSSVTEAMDALEQLGVASCAKTPVRDLSGGQKQRVLIARALVRKPDVLVLDEPTSGMDLASETSAMAFLKKLNAEQGVGIIQIVHNLSLLYPCAKQLIFVDHHRSLFACGDHNEMFDEAMLSQLYDAPVNISKTTDGAIVFGIRERGGI